MHLPILVIVAMLVSILAGARVYGAQSGTLVESGPGLTGTMPLPLTGKRRTAFEAYVADALYRFGVPGAAIVVVQNGDVVYLNGFGVKEIGSTRPVTPDTMMMIGSITKSMTTMLAASLIDDGRLAWGTRLIDLLPNFAVRAPRQLRPSRYARQSGCRAVVRDSACTRRCWRVCWPPAAGPWRMTRQGHLQSHQRFLRTVGYENSIC
jgi:CubicO group peptidase (beta-lactamase class C family)